MLNGLNSAQKEAVTHIDGALLILAGAGSGKTKTLTTRLAYLIAGVGIPPENTLTLTFTNKAASEMRERALSLIDNRSISSPPLLCTFHKFGLLFLKFYINKLGRENSFAIADSDDKRRLIRQIARDLKIDLSPSFIASEISKYKNSLLSPDEAISKAELSDYKKVARVYKSYQDTLLDNNLVDFDDLLMLTYQILYQDRDLRRYISQKYQYIMVDEYQDTNELQFRLLQLLASEHNNLCVVGDDDQSIYSWRGANVENILDFPKNFKDTKIVKLEVNYRSTKQILEVANSLIEHNRNRLGKRLISHRGDGVEIKLIHSIDENSEATTIAKRIKELLAKGVSAKEIAILYRINALSRSLEEGFLREGINFKIIGGMRFYERAEIKDIISYFRLLVNPNDDFSLLRIINKPKRGLGRTTIKRLTDSARVKKKPIYEIIFTLSEEELAEIVSKKSASSLKEFLQMLLLLRQKAKESLIDFIDEFEKIVGLRKFYELMPDGFDRVLNIDEFYGYIRDRVKKNPHLSLDELLNEISLLSEQDELDGSEAINLMSIHASKGLEFEHLFVIGLEEEFFPVLGDGCDIEEERRLAYVAITRAKTHLSLCYSDSRFYRGRRKILRKSRFLGEAGLFKNSKFELSRGSSYKKGDLVKHKLFGIGRVQAVTKSGREYKLLINFGGVKKEILSSFVKPI